MFLERGYAGTTVNGIADACGISRAGFYIHFKDKRAVFATLGEMAHRDNMTILNSLIVLDRPLGVEQLREFVESYYRFPDRHGAFVLAATHSAPDDEEFRRTQHCAQMRSSFKLGHALAPVGGRPPEALGATVIGMLDRGWHTHQTQWVSVERADMVAAAADIMMANAP